MRDELRVSGVCDTAVDDAVLILSELLTNACRHGRPLPHATDPGAAVASDDGGDVLAAWCVDAAGRLTVEVTDGGGPTRPVPAKPSVTARGGRGLSIITALADDWGVRDGIRGGVTVWVVVHLEAVDDVDEAAPGFPGGLTGRLDGPGSQVRPDGRTPPGTGPAGSDGADHANGSANGHGHRAGGGTAAVHPHRSGLGQSHRYGADRAVRLPARPMTAFQDRDFATSFDDQD
jgi:anti-sigma regulatory factor (Ser/Thr protein kinase)